MLDAQSIRWEAAARGVHIAATLHTPVVQHDALLQNLFGK